jgi:hypothetical protein
MSNNEEVNVRVDPALERGLIVANQLSYQMLPLLGICSARTHTIGFPQQSVYTNGETMSWDSQTGSFFVDPKGCYLKFSITHTIVNGGSDEAKRIKCFGSGSACNLFSRVVVRTRSGKELTRVENLNLLSKFVQLYNKPLDWVKTAGRAQGFSDPETVSEVYADEVPVGGKTFIIPLCDIIPFFNTIGNSLLPPQIFEGLRIEITLADPNVAFCNVDQDEGVGSVSTYTIHRPQMYFDCFTIADQFSRRISEIAATQGLNLLHKEYFHSSVGLEGTELNFDIKKAASKAMAAHVICREQKYITGDDAKKVDSMASAPYDWTSIQCQIGSLYNPNQPLTVSDISTNGNMEAYYFALYGNDRLSYSNTTCITPESYTGEDQTAGDKSVYNNTMVTFNLNKSNLEIVGSVINNSRALLINMRKNQQVAGSRIDAWLVHIRAVKCFTSNAVVAD